MVTRRPPCHIQRPRLRAKLKSHGSFLLLVRARNGSVAFRHIECGIHSCNEARIWWPGLIFPYFIPSRASESQRGIR